MIGAACCVHNWRMDRLRARIRFWTLFFMAGLLLSGATAVPIQSDLERAESLLGEDLRRRRTDPAQRGGVAAEHPRQRERHRGTRASHVLRMDWLAFGHVVVALAFIGALRDPVRNRWLYQFGMMACALVPPWAFVFGHLRGIPLWWQGIDAAFGVLGFIPMWLCHRWTGEIEAMEGSAT